jgi:hypothetical protein
VALAVDTGILIAALGAVAFLWRTRRFFNSVFDAVAAFHYLAYAVLCVVVTPMGLWNGMWTLALMTGCLGYVFAVAFIGNYVCIPASVERRSTWALLVALLAAVAFFMEAGLGIYY